MDDVIRRKAAIDALGERPMVWGNGDDYSLGEMNQYDMDKLAIETVPAADAVPVVRCRDCRFATWYTAVDGVKRCFCDSHGSAGHTETDFCSYAEREEMD